MGPFLKKAVWMLGLVLPALLVYRTQRELDNMRSIHFVDRRPVFLPNGKTLVAITMGHRASVGDWLWIRTVLYYGRRVVDTENPYYALALRHGTFKQETAVLSEPDPATSQPLLKIQRDMSRNLYRFESRGLVEYIYPMLDRVTTVDPHFIFPYLFGGVYVLMDTGEIDAALSLLDKGYAANPQSWELPFYLGWINWMYKSDLQKTYQYLLEAVGKPGCRSFVMYLLRGVSQNLNRNEMTRLYLLSLHESTDNVDVKKRIEAALEELSKSAKP